MRFRFCWRMRSGGVSCGARRSESGAVRRGMCGAFGGRRGDTLIEVTLAVGIFSMVAIAVVAVVSGSTSSAQSALEQTLTREEIDAQAEAIRFIHSSYVAGGESNTANNDRYKKLWEKLTALGDANAGRVADSDDFAKALLNYSPSTCDELYNSQRTDGFSIFDQNAFIINTHDMAAQDGNDGTDSFIDKIIISANINNVANDKLFRAADTYPRIWYASENTDNATGDILYDSGATNNINIVEGLFVIPLRDSENGTLIVTDKGQIKDSAAYYDFYIRSCWFGPGADRPSTISTVIRLLDPNAVTHQQTTANGGSIPGEPDDDTEPLEGDGDEEHIDVYEGVGIE